MELFDEVFDRVLLREGGYGNQPNDSGGETAYGITHKVALKHKWFKPMRLLPVEKAKEIYFKDYWRYPSFDEVALVSEELAEKLFDMGVNLGVKRTIVYLQKVLNALNKKEELYPDVIVDSFLGFDTMSSIRSYLRKRKVEALVTGLSCLQGEYYIFISKKWEKNEDFTYGWLMNRVKL